MPRIRHAYDEVGTSTLQTRNHAAKMAATLLPPFFLDEARTSGKVHRIDNDFPGVVASKIIDDSVVLCSRDVRTASDYANSFHLRTRFNR